MGTVSSYTTTRGRRWRVRYRTPDHRQTDKRGFRTKRDAEEFLAAVEVAKLRGEWVNPGSFPGDRGGVGGAVVRRPAAGEADDEIRLTPLARQAPDTAVGDSAAS